MQEGATFPTVFLTAWYALHQLAHVRSGESILVHSAAGGVGSALCQLGKRAGCHVTGVVGGAHKVAAAKAAGADVVIDKRSQALWKIAAESFDVVLDANGVETLGQSYARLAPQGRLVIYGFHTMLQRGRDRPNWPKLVWSWLRTPRFNPLDLTTSNKSVMGFNLSFLFHRADILEAAMDDLLQALAAGEIRALGTTSFALAQVGDAHAALETGSTTGKLVLEV
jgi:synaptic vesicle membrane protein VAT-1